MQQLRIQHDHKHKQGQVTEASDPALQVGVSAELRDGEMQKAFSSLEIDLVILKSRGFYLKK